MKYFFALLLALAGCAHTGEDQAQTALAAVDVGVGALIHEYVAAVTQVREHCAQTTDVPKCEDRFRVTDADVNDVQAAFESLAKSYDAVVVILPQLTEIKKAANELHQ